MVRLKSQRDSLTPAQKLADELVEAVRMCLPIVGKAYGGGSWTVSDAACAAARASLVLTKIKGDE